MHLNHLICSLFPRELKICSNRLSQFFLTNRLHKSDQLLMVALKVYMVDAMMNSKTFSFSSSIVSGLLEYSLALKYCHNKKSNSLYSGYRTGQGMIWRAFSTSNISYFCIQKYAEQKNLRRKDLEMSLQNIGKTVEMVFKYHTPGLEIYNTVQARCILILNLT